MPLKSVIPSYPLETNRAVKNQHFSIIKSDNVVKYLKSEHLVPHRKDYYLLVLNKKPIPNYWIDTACYQLKADTIYFTSPSQVHLKEEATPFTGISVAFTDDFLAMDRYHCLKNLSLIKNSNEAHTLPLTPEDIHYVEDILGKILLEYERQLRWKDLMLVNYVNVLFIYLNRIYEEQQRLRGPGHQRELLKKYSDVIDAHFMEIHAVSSFAEKLHVSPGYLNEVVKILTGKTAGQLIHNRLLLEARRLLFHSELSIKEIAFQLGFHDASYFNRFFKKLTQMTATLYRENSREKYR